MQANEELCDSYKQEFYTDANDKGWVRSIGYDTPRQLSKEYWLKARDSAVEYAKILNKIGLHKQIANRILEPWMHITVLLTGTEFENFFALRAHKDAQPEFQKLAYLMLDLYQQSEPKQLGRDEWHIPFGDKLDLDKVTELAIKSEANGFGVEEEMENAILNARLKISVARCARVSYLNFDGKDDYEADIALADRLASSGHWSPFEHCATPHLSGEIPIRCGNFLGWKQYRKFFPQENRRDGRVGDPRYLVKYS